MKFSSISLLLHSSSVFALVAELPSASLTTGIMNTTETLQSSLMGSLSRRRLRKRNEAIANVTLAVNDYQAKNSTGSNETQQAVITNNQMQSWGQPQGGVPPPNRPWTTNNQGPNNPMPGIVAEDDPAPQNLAAIGQSVNSGGNWGNNNGGGNWGNNNGGGNWGNNNMNGGGNWGNNNMHNNWQHHNQPVYHHSPPPPPPPHHPPPPPPHHPPPPPKTICRTCITTTTSVRPMMPMFPFTSLFGFGKHGF